MKLLIVTVIAEFEQETVQLFKKAEIESFSGSDIDGFKNPTAMVRSSSWFPSKKSGIDSSLFFSFTEDENIDVFFNLAKEFNKNLTTFNPIKAVVSPIERFI